MLIIGIIRNFHGDRFCRNNLLRLNIRLFVLDLLKKFCAFEKYVFRRGFFL